MSLICTVLADFGEGMATRRRKRQRRASAVLSQPLTVRLLRPLAVPARHVRSPSVAIEDRRSYHPLQKFRPARQWSGHPVKPNVVAKPSRKFSAALPFNTRFAAPARTMICVRRKTRKEVLFATMKTGKGARSRSRRRNYFSEVSC